MSEDEDKPKPEKMETPDDADAASFSDIESQVEDHFKGDWSMFLRALKNPVDVLHFVWVNEHERDGTKFRAWAEGKSIPIEWVERFLTALEDEVEED